MSDLSDDYLALGSKLAKVIADMGDPESRASGSDAAALSRARRSLGSEATDTEAVDRRADYDLLGEALALASGSGAAAVVTERRILRELLAALEAPVEVPLVDQLAERRQSRTKSGGAAGRRRKSG